MISDPTLSRHRLPHPYRTLLTVFWMLPIGLLLITSFVGSGAVFALFDPRFWGILGLMGVPAWYIWQEGVDVLPEGLRIRVYVPRYHAYDELTGWRLMRRQQETILTIWDEAQYKVLECHATHLSNLPMLLTALREHLPGDTTSGAAYQ
ncbi:MAG: hypothetical protein H7Y09_11605 [Chitinophagaceae bacterium]|nr:hypothetical protein [Anaerolineae bacterium]